jgi:putative NADH-flavin reductase
MLKVLIVAATGGLGQTLVRESLSRGHAVSVLARSQAKVDAVFGAIAGRLASVRIGDATDPAAVAAAVAGQDVVFSGLGGDATLARVVSEESLKAGVKKFVFVAGATNVMQEDGVSPMWPLFAPHWPPAERAYKLHQACIDAIRATGVNYVVFCPALMDAVGAVAVPPPAVRVNRASGGFVSYEDAAWVMMNAGESAQWDGQLITAATERKSKGEL